MKYKQKLFRFFHTHQEAHALPADETSCCQEIRQVLCNDLHDIIASGLALLRMQVSDMKRKAGGEGLAPSIEAASRTVDGLIRDTREIIWTVQQRNGLESTVHFISECFFSRMAPSGLDTNIYYPHALPDIDLPLMLRRCLIRCTKEAADLIASNSTGTEADFYVDITDESIRVRVRDNSAEGRLSSGECSRRLSIMEREIAAVGGTCSVFSTQAGTTAWFQAPFDHR